MKIDKNIQDFSKKIKEAAYLNEENFLIWFNDNENKNAMIISGYRDLFCSIIKNDIFDKIKTCSKKLVVLEIGCGSGRIMNAAAKIFHNIIGLDVHDNLEDTNKFLLDMGNHNTETKKIDNNIFPVEDKKIDFLYSFIVFQHLLEIDVFVAYSKEMERVLKKDGYAVIYFGRPRFLSKIIVKNKVINYLLFLFDFIFFENIYINLFKNGFLKYSDVEANDINLIVSKRKAQKIFENANFQIIESGTSFKKHGRGTQYYFFLRKQV